MKISAMLANMLMKAYISLESLVTHGKQKGDNSFGLFNCKWLTDTKYYTIPDFQMYRFNIGINGTGTITALTVQYLNGKLSHVTYKI